MDGSLVTFSWLCSCTKFPVTRYNHNRLRMYHRQLIEQTIERHVAGTTRVIYRGFCNRYMIFWIRTLFLDYPPLPTFNLCVLKCGIIRYLFYIVLHIYFNLKKMHFCFCSIQAENCIHPLKGILKPIKESQHVYLWDVNRQRTRRRVTFLLDRNRCVCEDFCCTLRNMRISNQL